MRVASAAGALLFLSCALCGTVSPVRAAGVPVDTLAGMTRFDTAVSISQAGHPGTAPAVVIATARDWPDVMGGAALSGATGGPLLLTERDAVPSAVLGEIQRLSPSHVYVLGGDGAVSESVVTRIRAALPQARVQRLGGVDRYATALEIADAVIERTGPGWDGHAFVATGRTFADPLAAGPLCAALEDPLYLVSGPSHSEDVILGMLADRVTRVTVLGGVGAVSDEIERDIAQALGGWERVRRIGGEDRYATAVLLARHAAKSLGFTWRSPGEKTLLTTRCGIPRIISSRPGSVRRDGSCAGGSWECRLAASSPSTRRRTPRPQRGESPEPPEHRVRRRPRRGRVGTLPTFAD